MSENRAKPRTRRRSSIFGLIPRIETDCPCCCSRSDSCRPFCPAARRRPSGCGSIAACESGQRSYIPGVGHIHVESVDEIKLADLTDEDGQADGFDSADALQMELSRIYPKELNAGFQAYRVRFCILAGKTNPEEK